MIAIHVRFPLALYTGGYNYLSSFYIWYIHDIYKLICISVYTYPLHQATKLFKKNPFESTITSVEMFNNQGQWCGPRSDEAWNDVRGPILSDLSVWDVQVVESVIYIQYIHMIILTFTHTHMLVLNVLFCCVYSMGIHGNIHLTCGLHA